MKIYLCGAHRTGKTKLAKLLAEHYKIEFLETKVANVISKNGTTTAKHLEAKSDAHETHELQRKISRYIDDMMMANRSKNFVTDRCMIDATAYSLHLFDEFSKTPELNDEENDQICAKYATLVSANYKAFTDHMRGDSYCFALLASDSIEFTKDEKSGGIDTQTFVEKKVLQLTKGRSNERIFVIPSEIASPEDRLKFIIQTINKNRILKKHK